MMKFKQMLIDNIRFNYVLSNPKLHYKRKLLNHYNVMRQRRLLEKRLNHEI